MTDDVRRRLEEASRAIEVRAREIEAEGGPVPPNIQAATEGHWAPTSDRVQVSYERYAEESEEDEPFDHGGCWQPHVRSGEYYDCDGRPL